MINININIVAIFIFSLILSDIIYILYKWKTGERPSGKHLLIISPPIIAFFLSLLFYDDYFFTYAKNYFLCFVMVFLIPINIICIKKGFFRTTKSAKNTFKDGKDFLKEEKQTLNVLRDFFKNRK